ncbi:uncharacterized protein LOC122509619 [Leptopilina heterotoma]|uniref:uncharacterized protein LOC122509619 n=1 Tax=Leptopilina heterotoma TaxID=63436 RepID=UPI001CA8A149|nr:uncharacterized protein LOC122509619 [Leptopilina heterotoma]
MIFSKIETNYMQCESDLEYEILQEYGLIAKNSYIIEVIIFYTVGVEYVSLPLIPFFLDIVRPLNESRPRSLIMLAEYYVDSNNDYNYIAITIHQVLVSLILATVIVTIDGIFIVFIYHASGQFKILGFVNEVSECFSMPYFFGLGLNMLMISFTGVQLIINLDNQSETVKLIIYNSGQIVRLFCLALPSQRLIDQSTLLFQHIYESYWYTLSYESKGMLGMLMLMCIKPVTFTAGKLFSFSMGTFSAVGINYQF